METVCPDVRPAARARLLAWVEDLVASGSCRAAGDGRFVLVCSQAELARRMGLSPTSGGVSKRFTALERMGVLVCRDPVLFDLTGHVPTAAGASDVDDTGGDQGERPVADTAVDHGRRAEGPDRLAVVINLLHRVCLLERVDLLDRVLEVVALTLDAPPTGGALPHSAPRAAPAPPVPSHSRTDTSVLRSTPFPSSLPASSLPASSLPASSLPASSLPAPGFPVAGGSPPVLPDGSASRGRTLRDDRYRFRRTPDAAARLQALAPLLEDCARRGLPGMGSPSGLLEAFDGYTLEQIARGVEFVRSQLAVASPLRSPVGLLAHMARTGDLALVEHVPTPVSSSDPVRDRTPSREPPGEWLARMGTLMREGDPPCRGPGV